MIGFTRKWTVVVGLTLMWPGSTRAETRGTVDLEFMTLRHVAGGGSRDSIFTLGGSVGPRLGAFVPYVGAGLGFFTAQARAGVALYPFGFYDTSLMVRLEVRPQAVILQCWQTAVTGQFGVGVHWPLEHRWANEEPGAGFFLLPAFEAGPGWLKADCGTLKEAPSHEREFLFGGTVAAGLDW